MQYLRKQLLLALAATATALAIAPTASAELEVTPNPHCPVVVLDGSAVSGGCLIHVSGPSVVLRKHVFGVESLLTTCDWEYSARIDEAGAGYIFDQVLSGAGCNRKPCEVGGVKSPWTIIGAETGAGAEAMMTSLCVKPTVGGAEESCEINIPFTSTPTEHHEFGTKVGGVVQEIGGATGGFFCELIGHWTTETDEPDEQYLDVKHV